MRHLLILAAAASLVLGCAGNTEDEVGAAPDRGDTTAVAADTAMATPTDSAMGQVSGDTSFVAEDTMTDTTMTDTMMTDTTMTDTTMTEPTTGADSVGAQGEVQTGDTTGAWTDTTGAAAPADSAAEPGY